MGLLVLLTGCARQPAGQIVIITATFPSEVAVVGPADGNNLALTPVQSVPDATPLATLALSPVPLQAATNPTPNPSRTLPDLPQEHVVQAGESLSAIAQRYNVSLSAMLEVNTLLNPDILSVGQTLNLPDGPATRGPSDKILPDGRIVRGPGSSGFDIAAFVENQPGYIRLSSDTVLKRGANGAGFEQRLTASEVIAQVSIEYSVDPRVLLILLEYRAGWLSQLNQPDERRSHPLISIANSAGIDRSGLYRQLAWAANELNRGYYGWKYRQFLTLDFVDGARLAYGDGLNPGTVALQYLLSRNTTLTQWQADVSPNGFFSLYYAYFGDPFAESVDPLMPPGLTQPLLQLPFNQGEIWYYTGGAHGGWGTGSGWSALDFAPPDDRSSSEGFCFTSNAWVTAVAPGVIARSAEGTVILDLDGDFDESTGWTIQYLHLDPSTTIAAGSSVSAGDNIGRASCAGGFSTATHLHIARRYNGEWIPIDCLNCVPETEPPPFIMSDWRAVGILGQEYQGYLVRGDTQLQAEQGRVTTINRVSW